MKIRNNQLLKYILPILALLFVFSEEVFALRLSHASPPYLIRFLMSVLTLSPLGIIVSILCYFIIRYFDRENCIKNKKRYLTIVVILMLLGSLMGAMDAHNDELWSPAMPGTGWVSLILPAAPFVLQKRMRRRVTIMVSLILALLSMWICGFITDTWQMYGLKLGLPTTW